jgi:hypothetical protein
MGTAVYKVIDVYSENNTKHINKFYRQDTELLNVKTGSKVSTVTINYY